MPMYVPTCAACAHERSADNDQIAFDEGHIVEGGVEGSIYDAQVHVTNKFLVTTGTDKKVHM
jgi:hypothetical protein